MALQKHEFRMSVQDILEMISHKIVDESQGLFSPASLHRLEFAETHIDTSKTYFDFVTYEELAPV